MIQTYHEPNYAANKLSYRRTNESKSLAEITDKIVQPKYGTFFKESLRVFNSKTGLELVKDKDYKCVGLDYTASKKSGRGCFKGFILLDTELKDIHYNYMFVGGDHINGLHLLDVVNEKFPEGIETSFPFDKVLGKPDLYKPKKHQMSIKSTYGLDGAKYSIDRMTDAVSRGLDKNVGRIKQIVDSIIVKLDGDVNDKFDELLDRVNKRFEELRVQDGEYIATDSAENPSISRGYGNWVRVDDVILSGVNDSDNTILGKTASVNQSLNGDQVSNAQRVRNCYIWKNVETNQKISTVTISFTSIVGQPVNQFYPEQDIVVNFTAVNTDLSVPLKYEIVLQNKELLPNMIYGSPFGTVKLDDNGKGSITIKFKDVMDVASLNFRVMVGFTKSNYASLKNRNPVKKLTPIISTDINGTKPISTLIEGQEFYLVINTVGYNVGDSIIVDDSLSTVRNGDLEIGYPPVLTVPSSKSIKIALKVKEDRLSEGTELLLLYLKNKAEDSINDTTPFVLADVLDTSVYNAATVIFKKHNTNTVITTTDEGVNVTCEVRTTLPNKKVLLQYNAGRPLTDFTGLVNEVTTVAENGINVARFNFTINNNNVTNPGVNFLNINALDPIYGVIGSNSLAIKDTSKTPDYKVSYIDNNGNVTTNVSEGNDFWLLIRVPGWIVNSNVPELIIKHRLEGSDDFTDVQLRVGGGLYTNLPFGPAAAAKNDVEWIDGNALKIRLSAIQDKLINGDVKLNTWVAGLGEEFKTDPSTSINIIDNSIPDVTVTFSSSAISLAPITSIDEMTSDGSNSQGYIWLETAGDLTNVGDITIDVDKPNELLNWAPVKVKLTSTIKRQIIPFSIKADFITDGNMTLNFTGVFTVFSKQRTLFEAPLTVIDNSVLHNLTLALSKTNTLPIVSSNEFNENTPFFVKVDLPALVFDTKLKTEVYQTVGGVDVLNTTDFKIVDVMVQPNTNYAWVVVEPTVDKTTENDEFFKLGITRYRSNDNLAISNKKISQQLKLIDSSAATSIKVELFTTEARTTIRTDTTYGEGDKIFARYTITDPRDAPNGDKLVFSVGTSNSSLLLVGGSHYKVIDIIPAQNGTHVVDVTFIKPINRYTDGDSDISIHGRLHYKPSPVIGDAISGNSAYSVSKKVTILDTSKTPTYSLALPSTQPKEDLLPFSIGLEVNDGTIGDVYYLSIINGFDESRFELNQNGVEQLLVLNDDTLNWNFKLKPNYKTDTNNTLAFFIINKTIGETIASGSVNVEDTSKTPILTLHALSKNGSVYTDLNKTIGEAGSGEYYVAVFGENLPLNEKIKLNWVSGRAVTDINDNDPAIWTTVFSVGNYNVDGVTKSGIVTPIKIKADKLTNPESDLKLTIRPDLSVSKATLTTNNTLTINDTSKTRTLNSFKWEIGGVEVTSVNEGQTVDLVLDATGGTDTFPVTIQNAGSYVVSERFTSSDIGVIKTQGISRFKFTIARDAKTNTADELLIKVKPVIDGVVSNTILSLPINDTSATTIASVDIRSSNNVPVSGNLNEGVDYKTRVAISNAESGKTYSLKLYTTVNSVPTTLASTILPLSGNAYDQILDFTVPADNKTNAGTKTLTIDIINSTEGKVIASLTKIVNDTSRSAIVAGTDFYLGDYNGTLAYTITEGSTFTFNFLSKVFGGIDVDKYVDGDAKINILAVQGTLAEIQANMADKVVSNIPVTKAMLSQLGSGKITIPKATVYDANTSHRQFKASISFYGYLAGYSNELVIDHIIPTASISDVYYSSNPEGTDRLTTLLEGVNAYLIVKTANVPKGHAITIDYTGSTTNSDDFVTASTDSPASITITTYNDSTGEGLGFYKLDSVYDGKVDFGKSITSIELVTDTTTMAKPTEIIGEGQLYLVIKTVGIRTQDKVSISLEGTELEKAKVTIDGTLIKTTVDVSPDTYDSVTGVGSAIVPVTIIGNN